MRKILIKILPILLLVVVMFSSCSKLEDFGGTNVNPGVTGSPVTQALFTNVLQGIGGYSAMNPQACYCQYYSETQYTDISLYSINNPTSSAQYSGRLMDLQNIIKTNDSITNPNQIALARILKAYIYWYVTDSWGDVPYSDALTGKSNVTYDTQESIYKDLIKELTEAVAQFDETTAVIRGDIAYNGDIAKWKKFANSTRALMALRLTKKYPAAGGYAATQFAAAIAAGVIESNADNFSLTYPGGGDNSVSFKHPFFNMYDGRSDYAESATVTTLLAGLADSRVNVFGSKMDGTASVQGFPYGLSRENANAFILANPNYAYVLAADYRQQTSTLVMIGAANVYLARAEAAQRGWTTENAQVMYQNGIDLSFAQWNAGTAYVSTLPGGAANLAAIQTQQYIAFYPNGWQGWANWRRTSTSANEAGVPALLPAPDAVNSGAGIPRRYAYGTVEENLTPEAFAVAVGRLTGGNLQSSHIWWDQE